MGKVIEIAEKLAKDVTSGSASIAKIFLSGVVEHGFTRDELEEAIGLLVKAHPDMAIIRNIERKLIGSAEGSESAVAKEILDSIEKAPEKIGMHLVALLPKEAVVITYSRSYTVFRALEICAKEGHIKRVIISEGRPDFEGVEFARNLADIGINVTLCIDAALGSFIDEVDAIVVGADAVTPAFVVNKVGTLFLALVANFENKPIYALASTHKFIDKMLPTKTIAPEKIMSQTHNKILVESPLFERVRLSLFSGIVSEQGLMGLPEIYKIVKQE